MTASVETQTPAPAAPVEVVTPILPSEALRLGRLTRPRRVTGQLTYGPGDACAVGAMLEGWGIDPSDHNGDYGVPEDLLRAFGTSCAQVWWRFDATEARGQNGDAAVLAYLESRGL